MDLAANGILWPTMNTPEMVFYTDCVKVGLSFSLFFRTIMNNCSVLYPTAVLKQYICIKYMDNRMLLLLLF